MKKLFIITLILLLAACTQKQTTAQKAMYFWKTNFQLSPTDTNFIQQNHIQKIYLRYCDIGLTNDIPVPIAPVIIDTASTKGHTIVPVVYLKNEIFLEIPHQNYLNELAEKLSKYIQQINNRYQLTVHEVQLDCDWTLKTKEAYFQFIEQLKKLQPNYQHSATIRLHQVKYFQKTGIPPVDYGVLMYYNMGEITPEGANSIYDRTTAKGYIGHLKNYPLPLNIALPMFSWGVHSVRGEVVNLVNELTTADIKTIAGVVPTSVPNVYRVQEQTYYNGRLWQVGDKIKIEEITEAQRQEMLTDLYSAMKEPPKEIIFFR